MDYILLIAGLGILLLGANYLVDGSVAIAQRAKISNFIIGLTVVGMGTSAPELMVSVTSAITGHGDMAVGNVVGSNICNVLLILGVTAVIAPFAIDSLTTRRDIPFAIGATLLLVLLANDSMVPGISANTLSRLDGIFMLLIMLAYMVWILIGKAKNPQAAIDEADGQCQSSLAGKPAWLLWMVVVASLAALIGGGQMFLQSAQRLAHAWGVSDAVIAITVVAVGTSLPELVTAVVAACKRNAQLALGNVIGSCVFNVLFILGLSAAISPISVQGVGIVDYGMMMLSMVLCYVVVFTFGKKKMDRIEGVIFLALYVAYTAWLLVH